MRPMPINLLPPARTGLLSEIVAKNMSLSSTNFNDVSLNIDGLAQVQVLAVGPWQDREFRLATDSIEAAAAWQTASNLDQAYECLETSETPPELILLAHSLPSQLRQQQIDKLQALVPLTRIVVVAGSWCEGGFRSGVQLTGVLRLYWHEFAIWWKLAQTRVEAGLCPPWSQPLDHPQAGRSMPHIRADWPTIAEPVAISAKDFAVYESLSAALEPFGMATVWMQPARNVQLQQKVAGGIWDGSQLDEKELQRLSDFCSQVKSNVVALLDYPRVEHIAQAREVGATTVLGKPYVVDELVEALFAGR